MMPETIEGADPWALLARIDKLARLELSREVCETVPADVLRDILDIINLPAGEA